MRVGGQKRRRNSVIAGLSIGAIIIIGFIILILHMNKNADYRHEVIFQEEGFQMTGLHGGIYEYNAISSVELKNDIPEIIARTKGVAVDTVKKGTFELEGLGLTQLYLVVDEGPYLYVKVNDFYVIMNEEVPDKLKEIYAEMLKVLEEK